jgi:hypothetical protein
MTDFYVYEYRLPNAEFPFYVGKGVRGRMNVHFNQAKKMEQTENRFMLKLQELHIAGVQPSITKLITGLSSQEARDEEEKLIAKYGRLGYDDGGALLNVQRSGTAWRHTSNTKTKISESSKKCIADGRMKTWAASLTPEERKINVTRGNKSRAKPLYAYSPVDGTFMKEFPPYKDTIILLAAHTCGLSLALKDPRVECAGYLWSHAKLENIGVTQAEVDARQIWCSRPKGAKPIKQISLDGATKEWPSISAVIREYGGHHGLFEKAISSGKELFASTWVR